MKLASTVLAVLGFANVGYSADAKFQVDQTLYSYTSTDQTVKPDGGEDIKTKTTDMNGTVSDLRVKIEIGAFNLYMWPNVLTDGTSDATSSTQALKFGYDVMPALEAGLILGRATHSVDEPKEESAIQAFGLYGLYAMPMFEGEFSFMSKSSTSKTDTVDSTSGAVTTSKSNLSGTAIGLNLSYIHNCAKAFSYVGGLDYTIVSAEEKESKMKISATTLGLRLIGFRLNF